MSHPYTTRRHTTKEFRKLGVHDVKAPLVCVGCHCTTVKVDEDGRCLVCVIRGVVATGKAKLAKRREVPQVYMPEVYTFGVAFGRAG